ncbi:MAG: hypothetical protein GY836_18915 [Herbaspirillum sp.]|uniref:hypothetical protein n=1 Tax=Herbaspirillum sp. TaxID=1890675 RepID=UPI00258AD7DC|nr:hypothetical protein [Herbaspirillum sp.]MCP4557480.1 hypothetical protein [Herbaspirillum sp.]
MSSDRLDNLARNGQLKKEPPRADELAGLRRSGLARIADAQRRDLSFESRFDLAYNAAHALALCALRRMGYRSEHRYLVFQTLPHTVGLAAGQWRVLAKAHETRNFAEYEGYLEQDERLLADVLAATRALIAALPEDERE